MFWKCHASHWLVFLTVTLLCLILRENYPFSNFPMYSSFSKKSFVIYLADAAGDPLPTTRFGRATGYLQKIFGSKRARQLMQLKTGEVHPVDVDKTAAAALLQYLDDLPVVRAQPALLCGVQVRRMNIVWNAGRISCTTETLEQHP
jgi:hypothetical protein